MASEFKHEGCETGQIRKVYHLILLQRRRREKGLIRTKKRHFLWCLLVMETCYHINQKGILSRKMKISEK